MLRFITLRSEEFPHLNLPIKPIQQSVINFSLLAALIMLVTIAMRETIARGCDVRLFFNELSAHQIDPLPDILPRVRAVVVSELTGRFFMPYVFGSIGSSVVRKRSPCGSRALA